MVKLNVEKRDSKISLMTLRKSGKMPAIFYGPKEESTSISLSQAQFEKVLEEAGESTIITLSGDGVDVDVLIHDVDLDPVTDKPRHADFYAIEKGKKLEVKVPLEFIGVAPAVKDLGGVLVKVMHELEIEALPKDLPHNLVVDISALVAFDSVITVKDIQVPAGVEVKLKPEDVVASVYEPKDEPIEPVVAPDLSTIEVEKKGKEAKEGEEGATEEAPKEKEEKKDKK